MQLRTSVIAAASFVLACGVASVGAADKVLTPQQQRMGDCNAQASGKKGDERKTFLSACLKGEPAHVQTQQEKMKTCNADASSNKLAGDARKSYMSKCLKGDGAHAAAH